MENVHGNIPRPSSMSLSGVSRRVEGYARGRQGSGPGSTEVSLNALHTRMPILERAFAFISGIQMLTEHGIDCAPVSDIMCVVFVMFFHLQSPHGH